MVKYRVYNDNGYKEYTDIEDVLGLNYEEIEIQLPNPNHLIEEYEKYVKRKSDGIEVYLGLASELRVKKILGEISEDTHLGIEEILEPVRSEIVLGQWVNAKYKILAIEPNEILTEELYNRLVTIIVKYIQDNYESYELTDITNI